MTAVDTAAPSPNPPTRTVLPLAAATDPAHVGAKAAVLARLAAAGLPVPPGVVIPADARPVAPGAAAPDVDEELARELLAAVAAWGDVPLAVRSSGIAEDGAHASFAGLYTTVLDVRGAQALLAAVRECWASADADRVRRYAGSGTDAARLAVLVQPLVPAVAAGVAFTADPVTGARDRVVLDAVRGLGERLVSGAATPERWTATADGDLRREPGSAEPALTPDQAAAVAALARRVEGVLGGPQDVEWAVTATSVVLLQARPVTAVPVPDVEPVPVPVEPPPGYWIREGSHSQAPWTEFGRRVLAARTDGVRRTAEDFGLLFDTLEFRDIGGWEYVRVVPLGGREPRPVPAWVTAVAVRAVPALRRRARRAAAALRDDRPARTVERWTSQELGEFEERIGALRDVDTDALDGPALARHLQGTLALADHGMDVHMRIHGALALVLHELSEVTSALLGWDDMATMALVSGTSHRSTAPARALAALAAAVERVPAVRRLVDEGAPPEQVLAADPAFAAAFRDYLRDYCCRALRYEASEPALDERPDLVLALLRDQLATGYDPARADAELLAAREAAVARARAGLSGRPEADRRRFEEALRRATAAYPVREDNVFLTVNAPVALARRAALAAGRRLVAAGELDRVDDAFHLSEAELVAALESPAARDRDGDAERTGLRALARRRRGERAWVLAHPGPESFGTPPPPPSMAGLPGPARTTMEAFLANNARIFGTSPLPAENDGATATGRPGAAAGAGVPRGVLHGVPAATGTYTGPVRVIASEEEFGRIRPGDVLVCPATSPVWSVVFPAIGALVTDTGGILSHPAIIAREYGIPAVVATVDGTRLLRDGEIVTVDGTAGTVHPHRAPLGGPGLDQR